MTTPEKARSATEAARLRARADRLYGLAARAYEKSEFWHFKGERYDGQARELERAAAAIEGAQDA